MDISEDARVEPSDSRWVGQWWMGFIIATGAIVVTSIPLFFYKADPPRDIGTEVEDADSELNEELINNSTASSQMSFGSSIWELPALLLRKEDPKLSSYRTSFESNVLIQFVDLLPSMIKNHVFIIVTLIMCCEFSIVVAFMTFMPKYIQDQFSIDSSKGSFFFRSFKK